MAKSHDLNSLDKFRKHPGRLVLEMHSHCEVPAGCGGVVLRWRNPLAARPFACRLFKAGPATTSIDGTALATSIIDLRPGPHLLSFVLGPVDFSAGFLAFALVATQAENIPSEAGTVVEPPLALLTQADRTWKFTLDKPADGWDTLAFDDATWAALAQVAPLTLDDRDPNRWAFQSCTYRGAVCLGLPRRKTAAAGEVWIRKQFDVPTPKLP